MPEPISIVNADLPGSRDTAREAHSEMRPASISQLIPGLVSIVMPAFNCEPVLAESIASVVAQTFPTWELLVVDDASTDSTLTIARKIAGTDQRIQVIHLARNGGAANARNIAMREARGQYLAFLDSDDLLLPE